MKMTIRPVLQNISKLTGKGSVYIVLDFKSQDRERTTKQIPVQIKVEKKYWLKNGRISKTHPNASVFNDLIETEIRKVSEVINYLKLRQIPLDPFTFNKAIETKSDSGKDLLFLVKKFNEEKSTSYNKRHREKFKNLEVRLDDFLGKKKLYPNQLDQNWVNSFSSYLQKEQPKHTNPQLRKSQQPNTINKTFSFLKQILKYFAEENIIDFSYKRLKYPSEKKVKQVVLSKAEIESLIKHTPSSNKLKRVKDLALIQLMSGLRYSDCIRIQAGHVDSSTLQITNKKTENVSSIPLYSSLKALLEKYDNDVSPLHISNQKYNEYLKELFREVGITNLVEKVTRDGNGKSVTNFLPKCDLIASHTLRRSFVTLALHAGVLPNMIQKFTGHSSSKQLNDYFHYLEGMAQAEANKLDDVFTFTSNDTNI